MIVKDLHVSTTVVDLVDPFFLKKRRRYNKLENHLKPAPKSATVQAKKNF
jgi:hypothetical protein